jgi:hypothetical protein
MRLQVVPIPVAIPANFALVTLLEMRLLVLPQTVHVFEARRACVALHILKWRQK